MTSETSAVRAAEIPTLNVEQMREVDRIMAEDLGIELLQMMENAGRALASRLGRCWVATQRAGR